MSTQVPDRSRYRVCFVCTGNICRSPMAEWVTRAGLTRMGIDSLVDVDSAGTGDWHAGEPADERATRVALDGGYDLTPPHVARQFRREWFAERDLVVALDAGHARTLRAMAPDHQAAARVRLLREYDLAGRAPAVDPEGDLDTDLDVGDPYYGDLAEFGHCLNVIEAACDGLLVELGRTVGGR